MDVFALIRYTWGLGVGHKPRVPGWAIYHCYLDTRSYLGTSKGNSGRAYHDIAAGTMDGGRGITGCVGLKKMQERVRTECAFPGMSTY